MLDEQVIAWLQECGAAPGENAAACAGIGNSITSPPVTDAEGRHYPQGRTIVGHTAEADEANLEEETPELPPACITLDISWLANACIHDALAFLPASTPAGFRVALPSPKAARLLLERTLLEGTPDAVVFKGTASATSVSALLEEVAFSQESLLIDAHIDSIKELLQAELGLQPGDFVELPALFIAGVPAMPNPVSCLICNGRVLMPAPNGPVINGIDVFEAAIRHKVALPEGDLRFAEVSESGFTAFGSAI